MLSSIRTYHLDQKSTIDVPLPSDSDILLWLSQSKKCRFTGAYYLYSDLISIF